jgi:MFS family permease
LGSNEGEFIAIARGVAQHLGDLRWWPEWALGLPFQNTYLPLLQAVTGVFSRVTGHSPALSFHQVSATFFCLGPAFLYLMACAMTRMPWASFLAALAYSSFSPCALLPKFRLDLGGLRNLRRLHILTFYGEGPHTTAMALIPLALLFLYLALTRGKLRDKVLAGVFLAASVLANAFGATILAAAVAALLASVRTERFWRNLWLVAAISALAYCWISPFLPPSVISAIRMNSPTADGDFRFTMRSAEGVAALVTGFALACLLTPKRTPAHLRFFLLFAWLMTGTVALGSLAQVYVVPQPHRYHIAMDMSLCLLAVFAGAAALRRISPRILTAAAVALLLALAVQTRHAIRYAHGTIRSADVAKSSMYKLTRAMDANVHGARVMVGGAYSTYFNIFSDTPQVHGGQDPMLPNFMLRIAVYTIYSGMNTGARDGEIATLWLKALGAHAVSVPGPHSDEGHNPFTNPRKFDGLLPLLWRERDDAIYGVPARSDSLAHVMAARDLVRNPPANGLDIAQLEKYVAALDAPAYPEAKWRWTSRHSAVIDAAVAPGQVISTQVTYTPGWRATAAEVSHDGLGLMVLKPTCQGPCQFALTYDGGREWRVTCLLSLAAMLAVLCLAVVALRRRQTGDLDGNRRQLPS